MRRGLIVVMSLAAVAVWTVPSLAGPGCKGCAKIKKVGHGFCDHCGGGKIFGLKVKSRAVYDVLAGSAEMGEKVKASPCPGCKKAFKTNGTCAHCGISVVDGRVYKSHAAYMLASGKLVTPEKAHKMASHCKGCAEAAKNGHGFCAECNAGMVANRMFAPKAKYEEAVKAYELVKTALKDAGHCENCAIARLTDGKCPHCKVSFKGGKAI